MKKDDINLRKIVRRIFRAWPLFIIWIAIFGILSILCLLVFPPMFTIKTTLLIEQPKGTSDPSTIATNQQPVFRTDDYYYNNQKDAYTSYPLIKKTVEQLNLGVSYFNWFIINKPIYSTSPIRVTLDTLKTGRRMKDMPYGEPFYVNIVDSNKFHLEVDGENSLSGTDFSASGDYQFGQWIKIDQLVFKVEPSFFFRKSIEEGTDSTIYKNTYSFEFIDSNQLILALISGMSISQEDLNATDFSVSLFGALPDQKEDFFNTLNQNFIQNHFQQQTEVLRKAIGYIDDQLAKTQQALTQSEEDLEKYKRDNGITSLNTQANLLLQQTSKYEDEKVGYLAKNSYYSYLKNYLQAEENFSKLISPEAYGVSDPLLEKLTEDLVMLQQQKDALTTSGTTRNPQYNQIVAKIEGDKKTILETVKGFERSNNLMIGHINGQIDKMESQSKAIPEAEKALMRLERDNKFNEDLYTNLMNKKSEAEIELVSTTPDFKVIEPAFPTNPKALFPNILILGVLSILLGLIFAPINLILKSLLSNRLNSVEDISNNLQSAVLLPSLSLTNIKSPLEIFQYPNSQTSHELKRILDVIKIQFPDQHRVLALSSPQSREGKSFLASTIATRSALNESKTLIVDLNRRDPQLHRLFKLSNERGLRDYIYEHVPLSNLIQHSKNEYLDILSYGQRDKEGEISPKALQALLDEVKGSYDLVVLDTAPLGLISNSLDLIRLADIQMFIVRRKVTTLDSLENLETMIQQNKLPHSTILLTDSIDSFTGSRQRRQKKYIKNKPKSLRFRYRNLMKWI